jgi:HK97 family phage portal protein
LPTSISANTADVNSPAWSVSVVNELSNDYDNMARPYCDNPVVRAAVEAMRRNATKATLQVGRFDEDGGFEPVEHPLLNIWPNPFPGYTDANLIEEVYSSLIGEEGDGNAYVQLIADKTGDAIVELFPIPPLWVRYPRMGETFGEVLSWPVNGADWGRTYSFDVPSNQMVHIKTGRSSGGPTLGKSALRAVAADMALIKLASIYETTILTRAGVPSLIIKILGTAGMMLNDTQIRQIQSDFSRATSGRAVGRPAVTKGDVDISTPGFSPEQLSVAEMTNMAVSRVCGVLGWAPMTLKQPDTGKTYSNLIEANKASWRDAILPFLEQIATSLTKAVQTMPFRYGDELAEPDPTLSVRFDTSQIEELAADMDKMADRAVKLMTAGIYTIEEARSIMGLGEMEEEDMNPETETEDTENEGEQSGERNRNDD